MPSPRGLPLIGHSIDLSRIDRENESTQLRARWTAELGHPKLMKVELWGTPVVIVSDMDFAKNVLLSKTNQLPRQLGGFMTKVLGNDPKAKAILLLDTFTPFAKALRRAYLRAFQSSSLKHAFPKLKKVLNRAAAVVEARREHGSIDFQELCSNLSLDVIGAVALDMDLGSLEGGNHIRSLLQATVVISRKDLFNPFLRLYKSMLPNSTLALTQTATIDGLTAEWDRLTKEILLREDPPEGDTPLWYVLRNMEDPETRKPISYRDLRAEVASVVVSGTDTTGHQMAWILAALASYPNVVDALLEELDQHGLYGESARDLTFEDLSELHYLAAIIKEGVRFVSSLPGLPYRKATQDMSVLGYRVPKGTLLTLAANRWFDSAADWGDPRVFRPERWLNEAEGAAKNYYLGFSYGPRDCAGQRLAVMELRAAVVRFVTRYKLSLTVPLEALMKNTRTGIAIHAIDGIRLIVEPRY